MAHTQKSYERSRNWEKSPQGRMLACKSRTPLYPLPVTNEYSVTGSVPSPKSYYQTVIAEFRNNVSKRTDVGREKSDYRLRISSNCNPQVSIFENNVFPRQSGYNTSRSSVDRSSVDRSLVDKYTVDRSSMHRSSIDRSSVNRSSVHRILVDESAMDRFSLGRSSVGRCSMGRCSVGRSSVGRSSVDRSSIIGGQETYERPCSAPSSGWPCPARGLWNNRTANNGSSDSNKYNRRHAPAGHLHRTCEYHNQNTYKNCKRPSTADCTGSSSTYSTRRQCEEKQSRSWRPTGLQEDRIGPGNDDEYRQKSERSSRWSYYSYVPDNKTTAPPRSESRKRKHGSNINVLGKEETDRAILKEMLVQQYNGNRIPKLERIKDNVTKIERMATKKSDVLEIKPERNEQTETHSPNVNVLDEKWLSEPIIIEAETKHTKKPLIPRMEPRETNVSQLEGNVSGKLCGLKVKPEGTKWNERTKTNWPNFNVTFGRRTNESKVGEVVIEETSDSKTEHRESRKHSESQMEETVSRKSDALISPPEVVKRNECTKMESINPKEINISKVECYTEKFTETIDSNKPSTVFNCSIKKVGNEDIDKKNTVPFLLGHSLGETTEREANSETEEIRRDEFKLTDNFAHS